MTLMRSQKSCILYQINLPESFLELSNPWLKRLLFALKPMYFSRGRKIAPTARFAKVFYTPLQ